MSLKIKKLTGEIFDLPPDYVIESEKNNPLFSNKGSQTVPISFQNTANNRRLLEYAYRLDVSVKPSQKIPVVIESGPAQQSGLMAINSASDKLISANIGWDESEMYANMGSTWLKDIKDLPVYQAAGTSDRNMLVEAMLVHLSLVMKEKLDADYYVFPLILKKDTVESKPYFETLNECDAAPKYDENNQLVPYNGAMGELLAYNAQVLSRCVDGEVVKFDVPKGYGISPFLKVWRILELIFVNEYGLALENNPFKDHPQLKKLVVLNNTMDSILTGRLNYKDMMPDITITEFLDALYNKFGLQYFINSNTKSVSLMFWKDILSPDQFSMDFTKYKTAPVTINYTSPKQIKLIANREIEGTKVQYKTFEEFLEAYEYQFAEFRGESDFNRNYSSIFNAVYRTYNIKDLQGSDGYGYAISSDFFDWDKKANLPYEEIRMNDLCLPFNGSQLLHYLVGYKHAYSGVLISGEAVEEIQSPAKLAFAFGWGKTNYTSPYLPQYFFASQDNRNETGEFIVDQNGKRYDISLTCHREDGLFNRFWKQYDAFLRHSNDGVDAKLKLPASEIVKLKMFQPVIIDGQPLLPEQIKFKQNKTDAVSDGKFRTLRLYQPYDLSIEQEIRAYHPQEYYWKLISTERIPNIEEQLDNHNPKVPYEIIGNDSTAQEGDRRSLQWLPPNESEYQNQLPRLFEYYYVVHIPESNLPNNHWKETWVTVRLVATFSSTKVVL